MNNMSRRYCRREFNRVLCYSSVLLFFCASLLSGCGGAKTKPLSAIHQSAIEHNQKGMKAAEKQDYDRALRYYEHALILNRSIENIEGTGINLINIAVIYQKMNNPHDAHKFIDSALALPDLSSVIKSEAAYEKARIYFKENNLTKSKEWAEYALSVNKGPRDGSRVNILGRIALIENRYDEALSLADSALSLNINNKDKLEEANSLRLLAQANMQNGRYEKSNEFYLRALDMDKALGNSHGIAMDLRGIGELFLKKGDVNNSIDFFKRAYNVNINSGDINSALSDLELLEKIYRGLGDEKKAQDILNKKSDLEKKADIK